MYKYIYCILYERLNQVEVITTFRVLTSFVRADLVNNTRGLNINNNRKKERKENNNDKTLISRGCDGAEDCRRRV